mgnify:CR=1 FL=1
MYFESGLHLQLFQTVLPNPLEMNNHLDDIPLLNLSLLDLLELLQLCHNLVLF